MDVMWRSCEEGRWMSFYFLFMLVVVVDCRPGFCFYIPIRRHTLYQ
jgi:hypothetical protein